MTGLKVQAAAYRRHAACSNWARVNKKEYRVYLGLLVFVVAAGLPMLAFPALRHRLQARVHTIYEAMGPFSLKSLPAWAKVGENKYPFPAEFERPLPRGQYSGIINLPNAVYRAREPIVSADSPRASTTDASEMSRDAGGSGDKAQPDYRQGKTEQEAFDLLVQSSDTLKGMVKESSPTLRFKTWAAAKMEEDAFWVRLTFTQLPENTEAHYIWQVKLLSKEVIPLSHNARALAKP